MEARTALGDAVQEVRVALCWALLPDVCWEWRADSHMPGRERLCPYIPGIMAPMDRGSDLFQTLMNMAPAVWFAPFVDEKTGATFFPLFGSAQEIRCGTYAEARMRGEKIMAAWVKWKVGK